VEQSDSIAPSFNLWTQPWIEVEHDGMVTRHSISDTLLNAHKYVEIYDQSPLVIAGVHRLLVAILQDALDPRENSDLDQLWKDGRFSSQKIKQFEVLHYDRFDLFSEDKPFFQSSDLPLKSEKKTDQKMNTTVARLFPELPSGTLVTHYRHNSQIEQIFSPATAALGLVAIPPFTSSGGHGMIPSINGVPPIYVFPGGRTLFESLAASLISSVKLEDDFVAKEKDLAWWTRPLPVVVQERKCRKKAC
jgi:CRISPR system Cascade subunit CasA